MENNVVSTNIRYHYDMLRDNTDKIVDKLNSNMGFYAFRYVRNIKTIEIVYDTAENLLSSIGIILSKQFIGDSIAFYVRKITRLPNEMKRPSKRIKIADCGQSETPKSFAAQIARAINNTFPSIFTIDLAEVVEKTMPKIEIDIKGQYYDISGGTGFRASMIFENVIYRDMLTRKKVKRKSVTLTLPIDAMYEKDSENVLGGIDKYCKELIPYKESRVEIAERVLFPKRSGKTNIKDLIKQEKEAKKKNKEE